MVNWRLFLGERVSRFRNDNVRHGCHRSGKFKGKWITSRHGKSPGISLWVRENWHLWTESGKSKILSKYGVVHLAIAIFITVDKAWNVCSNGVGTMVNKIWKNMAGKMLKGMTSLFGIIWKRLVDCMGETWYELKGLTDWVFVTVMWVDEYVYDGSYERPSGTGTLLNGRRRVWRSWLGMKWNG